MDTTGLFARNFIAALRENDSEILAESCRSTFRRDRLGNRVEVDYGGTFKAGKNGKGVSIPKGYTAKEDSTGQMHALAPGEVLKVGSNGKGVPICLGEPTSEKKGQIVVNRKKPKMESRRP